MLFLFWSGYFSLFFSTAAEKTFCGEIEGSHSPSLRFFFSFPGEAFPLHRRRRRRRIISGFCGAVSSPIDSQPWIITASFFFSFFFLCADNRHYPNCTDKIKQGLKMRRKVTFWTPAHSLQTRFKNWKKCFACQYIVHVFQTSFIKIHVTSSMYGHGKTNQGLKSTDSGVNVTHYLPDQMTLTNGQEYFLCHE